MKNSTVENSGPKPAKKLGPIRTGAVVPSIVLIALIWAYFYFFFDSHLRRGLEFAGSRIHGAEVNIGNIHTSFLGGSFLLTGLEVTDKEHPARNLFQVGEIRFGMLWDALLRMKFVVEEASVLDIRALTKREKPGFVLPPPPPEDSLLGRVQEQVVRQTRAKINDNFLGDIVKVLEGVDPKDQLKNIQADLKTNARAEALEKELVAKKAEWEKRIKEMPKPKEVKELEAKIKALDLKTKNPIELAKNLKKARDILSEAQAKAKQVEQGQRDLTSDITSYSKAMVDLEKLAEQDVADLQKRLQIPSIDPKAFSTQIFLSQVEGRLVSLRKYIALARKYLPPKKSAEEKADERAEAIVPRARGKGVTFSFPITTGYPLFWLKKAKVSSEINQSEWAGKVSGEITDLSTEPSVLKNPLKVHLAGDFPKQAIHGFDFLATIDHTTERARENLQVKVAAFPVADQLFSNTPEIKFGVKEAIGGGSLEATLADETLSVKIASHFEKPNFLFEAKNKRVSEIVGSVLNGIPRVTMGASVTGSWDSLAFDVDSNLGNELSAGFQKQLQAKLGEAKAKLDAFVKDKVAPAREKVRKQLDALTGGPGKLLGDQKTEMDGAVKGAEGSSKAGGDSPASPKNLLKGFGF